MSHSEKSHGSLFQSYLWIFIMLVIIVGKGLFSFYVVSDKGQPDWDFRPVRDVPSESEYASYKLLPYPQHVKGDKGE